MKGKRYTDEFKKEAVKQVTERGYSVSEVAERLGTTTHSLYLWLKSSEKCCSDRLNLQRQVLMDTRHMDPNLIKGDTPGGGGQLRLTRGVTSG